MPGSRWLVFVVAFAMASVSMVGAAAGADQIGSEGAVATATAARARRTTTDVVSVNETSELSATTRSQVELAAASVGAFSSPGGAAQVGMIRLSRDGATVQAPPSGYRIPMGLTVLPADAAVAVMSPTVAATLQAGSIVLGRLSASMRGAAVGDVITILDPAGRGVDYRLGLIASELEAGGAELVMTPDQAALIGAADVTRMLVWGFGSTAQIDAALSSAGLERRGVRIGRSWGPANPDSVLGVAALKSIAGEFSFVPNSDGSATLNPGWSTANIVRRNFTGVGIRASCNAAIVESIQGALSEIAAAGLAGEINTANTNTYGGCFNPRYNRVTGNLGFLSRHAWGAALDMNTTQNAQGSTPRLHCDVVRIFRKWGFAWGGNFVTPDGMHFEYVGEPRHTWMYPSTYCPNLSAYSADRAERRLEEAADSDAARRALFVDDGFAHE